MQCTQHSELVKYDRQGPIVHLLLNRPEKLNAFTDDMVRQLNDALRRFDGDPDALIAVISGAGRAFSSGADVGQRQNRSVEEFELLGGPEGWGAKAADLFTSSAHWKPVISAVHGYAIGMGLGIALSADLLVAEEGARFQITETQRGLSGVRYVELMRLRGPASFAFEAALTGRYFTAQEAHAGGVVDRVAPAGKLLDTAFELARGMATHPPLALRTIVRSRRYEIRRLETQCQLETDALKLHLTEDFKESARAFLEKRPAGAFRGC